MAERKTGVFPLNYLTEEDREIFTDSEIAELMVKTFHYLRTGEKPTFSKRIMSVRFKDHQEFFDSSMKAWQKKAESPNLLQNRNRTETEPKSERNRTENGYVYVNVNVNKKENTKRKKISDILEHDYTLEKIPDPRRKE